MLCSLRLFALGVLAIALISPVSAQSTPGPPDWEDSRSSVYLGNVPKTPPPVESARSTPNVASSAAPPAAAITTSRKLDSNVVPSAHEEAPAANEPSARRLAPPSARQENEKLTSRSGRTDAGARRLVDFGIPIESIYKIVTALTIVVGTFLVFVWLLRRGGRGAAGRRAILPAEAISVLGRVPLTGRQVAELLRVGNKLVLVALTPGGAETLTEVADPVEVDRLVGLCQQHDRHSTTKAFEHVFQQLSREPVGGGFLGADTLPASISPVAAAYRSHRGDSTRG